MPVRKSSCHLPPVLEEVLVEALLGGVVVVQHPAVERGALLRLLRQPHRLAVVPKAHLHIKI